MRRDIEEIKIEKVANGYIVDIIVFSTATGMCEKLVYKNDDELSAWARGFFKGDRDESHSLFVTMPPSSCPLITDVPIWKQC